MITIGRVVENGKVHMQMDGRGCGPCRGRRISTPIASDMLQWIKPDDLCRLCFTANRIRRASSLNAFSDARWNHNLDMFLSRLSIARPVDVTSPERLEQIRREIAARFQAEGVIR